MIINAWQGHWDTTLPDEEEYFFKAFKISKIHFENQINRPVKAAIKKIKITYAFIIFIGIMQKPMRLCLIKCRGELRAGVELDPRVTSKRPNHLVVQQILFSNPFSLVFLLRRIRFASSCKGVVYSAFMESRFMPLGWRLIAHGKLVRFAVVGFLFFPTKSPLS